MSPTSTYQATSIHPTYYELALDDESVGWVNYRSLTLASQGAGCNQLPTDDRELTEFPSLCFFEANGEVQTYIDRTLSKPYQMITSTISYVLLLQYSDVFYSSVSDTGPGFFVDAGQVSTFGACEAVPYAGFTIANGWLWSLPNGQIGKQIAPLESGRRVFIQEGPIPGTNPPYINGEGAWYFVLVSPAEEGLSGWVWSSLIFIE
jgi:hypothetical protein